MNISVITATYNRSQLLTRLYRSLSEQINKDFEWIIVDDGSTDNTEELVKLWIAESQFTLKYFKQENGGKCRAINKGVKEAIGKYTIIVDSDDFITDNKVLHNLSNMVNDLPDSDIFCGVVGNKLDLSGHIIGGKVDYDCLDTDLVTYREYFNYKGDKAEVIRSEVLREYPFPEFAGEKFMAEGVVWNRIALRYKVRYVNINLITCEYQPDGLSAQVVYCRRNSPQAFLLYYSEYCLHPKVKWINKIKKAIGYWAVYNTLRKDINYHAMKKRFLLLYPVAKLLNYNRQFI